MIPVQSNTSFGPEIPNEDVLFERLIVLEALLEADLERKSKHQKPKLQQQWREEISQINIQLGLD